MTPAENAPLARMSQPLGGLGLTLAIAVLLGGALAAQTVRDNRYAAWEAESSLLYVRSGAALTRLGLAFDDLLADLYWIRAVQHYGSTKVADEPDRTYDLLYPFLDLATTLDPRFNIAYRFGAIFLTEAYPDGPGQPDLAIALLEKGVAAMPEKWQYLMDIGFIHYWWIHDYEAAAEWFRVASEVEGAPWWLEPLAATTLAQGGQRGGSRLLWQQLFETSDNEWLQAEAGRRLLQLDALDALDQLGLAAQAYRDRNGDWPLTWAQLIETGLVPFEPVDPTGTGYILVPGTGEVELSSDSILFPLPTEPQALPDPAS